MAKGLDEALRGGKQSETGDGIRFSKKDKALISENEIKAIQGIGRKSVNLFNNSEKAATEKLANRYWNEMGAKSPFFRAWFGDWRAKDNTTVEIATEKGAERGIQRNEDTGWDIQVSGKVFIESNHSATRNKTAIPYLGHINDIVKKAVLLDSYTVGDKKSENSLFMHSLYAVADIGNGAELLKLYVEEMNDPNSNNTTKRAYQLQNIEKVGSPKVRSSGTIPSSIIQTADIHTVADLFEAVKSRETDFKPKAIQNVLLNEDGTPKIFYHGSDQEFTVFSPDEMSAVEGSFFLAENREDAEAYGANVYECYVSADNLADYDNQPSEFYKLRNKRKQVEWLKNKGYDGWYADMDSDGWGEISVFYNTQIKSATDNIGTFDGNNPDIRYSANDAADIDLYTESQYNKSGWARVNNAISAKENATFRRRLSDKQNGGWFNRTADGKYVFEVGNEFGVNNVLIVSDGKYINPSVERIYRIDFDTENEIGEIRSCIYDLENRSGERAYRTIAHHFGPELITCYRREDCPAYREVSRSRKRNSGKTNARTVEQQQDGSGDIGKTEPTVRYSGNDSTDTDTAQPADTSAIDSLVEDFERKEQAGQYMINIQRDRKCNYRLKNVGIF